MVIGLLTLASIPVVTGVAEGISHQSAAVERLKDAKRMAKFYIDVYCDAASSKTKYVHGRRVVLRDGKLYLDEHKPALRALPSYTAKAFYLVYPDDEVRYLILQDLAARGIVATANGVTQRNPPPMGLVSQVQDDPPLLNWIFVDKDTMEVRYGNRTVSREHYVGPWNWTVDPEVPTEAVFGGKGIICDGEELFMAVEDGNGEWQVYFDRNDDGLKGYVNKNRRRLQISLERSMVAEEDDGLDVRNREEARAADVRNMNLAGGIRVMPGASNVGSSNINQVNR